MIGLEPAIVSSYVGMGDIASRYDEPKISETSFWVKSGKACIKQKLEVMPISYGDILLWGCISLHRKLDAHPSTWALPRMRRVCPNRSPIFPRKVIRHLLILYVVYVSSFVFVYFFCISYFFYFVSATELFNYLLLLSSRFDSINCI